MKVSWDDTQSSRKRIGYPERESGERSVMVGDVLIAVVIIVIAALLGILVHPLLWLVLIVAALWLFSRRGSWSRA
jgi:hypothetical protein